MRQRLTQAFANTAQALPGQPRTAFWDVSQPGFGLIVLASGSRSWCVQYRAGGKSRRMSIRFRVPLKEARKQAKALQASVDKGSDPLEERRAQAAAAGNSFEA